MEKFYTDLTYRISELVTRSYSTSFSKAVSYLGKDTKEAVYSIYGFVRFADEIVDSFHGYEQKHLLEKFEADYYHALEHGISLNPVLQSFQKTVRKYNIPDDLIQAFLKSMKSDIHTKDYNTGEDIGEYIYGSAEVVGLMCLKVFLYGDDRLYDEFTESARRLGAAFQKVNFLRDIKNDTENLGRRYFPELISGGFNEKIKKIIVEDIRKDFILAYPGIKKLPRRSRLGVMIAYKYYRWLLKKIDRTPALKLLETRVRVPDARKLLLLAEALVENRLNMV